MLLPARSPLLAPSLSATELEEMPHSEGMDLWLRGRGTIQVAAQVKFRETRYSWEIEKQINTMLGQYEELFRFAWSDEWKKSENADGIPCDQIYRSTLQQLFLQYKSYSDQGSGLEVPSLDPAQFLFLEGRLSMFLRSISMMQSSRTYQTLGNVPIAEADREFAFDLLMMALWCEPDTIGTSDTYFIKNPLRLPLLKKVSGTMKISKLRRHLAVEQGVTHAGNHSVDPGSRVEETQTQQRKDGNSERETTGAERHTQNDNGSDSDSESEINAHRGCLICPLVSTASFPVINPTTSAQLESYSEATELSPLLFCEHKSGRSYQNSGMAFRRCQMDCIAGVESLRALGITDIPVYGMVRIGSHIMMLMAWHCVKSICAPGTPDADVKRGCTFLVDHNLISFDLREPLDAYRFAISIHRIYLSHKKLIAMLKAKNHESED